jgi:hypothetical protein
VRRTTTYHAIETGEPVSMWRWAGVALALVVALMGGRAWYTQREAKVTEKLEAARAELERRSDEQRQADRRRIEEREAQLQVKERSAADREEAARRAADREDALRRLDEERAARERIASAGEARKAAEDAKRAAVLEEKRERLIAQVAPLPGRVPERDDRSPPDKMGQGGFDNKMEQDFRQMDANGDGFLTPDEVRGRGPLERDFSRIDANGDGRLSLQELMNFRPPKPPPKFK